MAYILLTNIGIIGKITRYFTLKDCRALWARNDINTDMALTEIEQFKQLVSDSKHILIALPAQAETDATASALALQLFLTASHKQVDIVSADFVMPKNLKFLTGVEKIKPELEHLQKFIIKVDVSKAKIDSISYDIKDSWLSIYLTPRSGTVGASDLRTAQTTYRYDFVITLGAPDLASLGEVFANNTDLFYRLPIINIDTNAGNERFGKINFVDLSAAGVAEMLFKLLQQINEPQITAEIATALLTGITAATHSFKSPHVSPLSLKHASTLVSMGADREKIITHLYRTKTLSALKMWGQALAHLKFNPELKLASVVITRDDFTRAGARAEELAGLAEELIGSAPEAELTLLMYEDPTDGVVNGLLHANSKYDAKQLTAAFGSEGNKKQARFILTGVDLVGAEEKVVEQLKNLNSKS
ncbi:MAG: hypothetical protein A3J93_01655 [Candidatus Magasanikbacteria bacterium RIFOXYC2_FULL_42_28]|uniref:DDH domain-containing protein n=1 Tax=Candidatus Magasanikbacteria bacterium RIFOXYC2_FULL_42_28 TaxID=1798704 RepID=A0A1F6NXX0_9BACT|nr:MAG: hypothetical protein A3J93_01655 [Candidatus Magasanikbacteria bacterium RIFOXYC2_FULL_42_28]